MDGGKRQGKEEVGKHREINAKSGEESICVNV